jgi:hypothetical protein
MAAAAGVGGKRGASCSDCKPLVSSITGTGGRSGSGSGAPPVDAATLAFCRRLPKAELHAHLNGCIRDATLRELASQAGVAVDDVAFQCGAGLAVGT